MAWFLAALMVLGGVAAAAEVAVDFEADGIALAPEGSGDFPVLLDGMGQLVLELDAPMEAGEEAPEVEAGLCSNADGLKIDASAFPDENFRDYIRECIDLDLDGVLSAEEIDTAVFLDMSQREIESLSGIGNFPKLQALQCQGNRLTSLDLRKCQELTSLDCGDNHIKTLKLKGCAALTDLVCSNNRLKSLDLTGCKALTYLTANGNALKTLTLKGCKALESLNCSDNKLSALNLADCRALVDLDCSDNRLTALDVRECKALNFLNCSKNKLTELNVKHNRLLTELSCASNALPKLTLTKNAGLTLLDCHDNKLTAINVSRSEGLSILDCTGNSISQMEASNLSAKLRKLLGDNDLRYWNNGMISWRKSEKCFMIFSTPVTVRNGASVLYDQDDFCDSLRVSREREDYSWLSDADYANFRVVKTTGMGRNALCRGPHPLWANINRNKETLAAMQAVGVRTIINMCEDASEVRVHPSFKGSSYSRSNLWAKKMNQKVTSSAFKKDVASICRFMIEHEGPYMVHCVMGRDRTGFFCAMVECLMGGTLKQVTKDYMKTFKNYYNIKKGTWEYDYIVANKLMAKLNAAFKVKDVSAAGVDLAASATGYLQRCGLSDQEIEAFKARLATNY